MLVPAPLFYSPLINDLFTGLCSPSPPSPVLLSWLCLVLPCSLSPTQPLNPPKRRTSSC